TSLPRWLRPTAPPTPSGSELLSQNTLPNRTGEPQGERVGWMLPLISSMVNPPFVLRVTEIESHTRNRDARPKAPPRSERYRPRVAACWLPALAVYCGRHDRRSRRRRPLDAPTPRRGSRGRQSGEAHRPHVPSRRRTKS